MARGFFRQGIRAFLDGEIDVIKDTIQASLVDVDLWHPSPSAHRTIADVPQAARAATTTLTGKSIEGGCFYADDLIFDTVGPASPDEPPASVELLYWKDTGDESTSTLIAIMGRDGSNRHEWPVYTNGGDIKVHFTDWPLFSIPGGESWDE